jgi:hypothetical protein
VTATGNANISGYLQDSTRIRGSGQIDSAEIRVQDTVLRPARPFAFAFTASELNVTDVTLTGQSTQVTLGGTIGLRDPAPLNLTVKGQVDLKLIEAQVPELLSSGVVDVQIDVRGTVQNPDLRGVGVVSNASLRRQGFFTGLTNVSGTLSFNQNQIRWTISRAPPVEALFTRRAPPFCRAEQFSPWLFRSTRRRFDYADIRKVSEQSSTPTSTCADQSIHPFSTAASKLRASITAAASKIFLL